MGKAGKKSGLMKGKIKRRILELEEIFYSNHFILGKQTVAQTTECNLPKRTKYQYILEEPLPRFTKNP